MSEVMNGADLPQRVRAVIHEVAEVYAEHEARGERIRNLDALNERQAKTITELQLKTASDPELLASTNAALAAAKARASDAEAHLAIERAARKAVDNRFRELQEENTRLDGALSEKCEHNRELELLLSKRVSDNARLLAENNNLKRDALTGKHETIRVGSEVELTKVEFVGGERINSIAVDRPAIITVEDAEGRTYHFSVVEKGK